MQLFLASILSCAALLVGILAQVDWKPYSSTEESSVAMPDDSRTGPILADSGPGHQFADIASVINGNPAEFPASWADRRAVETRATEKIPSRRGDVAIRQKERKLLTESPVLLARHDGHTFVLEDQAGPTIKMRFDFDEHSFEMLATRLSKEKLAKIKKFTTTLKIPTLAERELRREFTRAQRQERSERRQAQREQQDEYIRVEALRAEPAESRREQSDYPRIDIPEKIDKSNP